jgi:hypothetical protein
MAELADDMIRLVAGFLPLESVACMLRACRVWKHALDTLPSLQSSYTYSTPTHRIWNHVLARHIVSMNMQLHKAGEPGIEAMRSVCGHMPWLTSLQINPPPCNAPLPPPMVWPISLRVLKFKGDFVRAYLQAAIDALDSAPLIESLTHVDWSNTLQSFDLSAVQRARCLTELRINQRLSNVAQHMTPLFCAPSLRRVWLNGFTRGCAQALRNASPLPWTSVEFGWHEPIGTLVVAIDTLFPRLTHLSVNVKCLFLLPDALCTRLSYLRVFFGDEDEPVEACLSRCTALEELQVDSDCQGNIDFSRVVLPRLRKLRVFAASITSMNGTFPCLYAVTFLVTRFEPSVVHELFALDSLTHLRLRHAYAAERAAAIDPVLFACAPRLARFEYSMDA